MFISSPIHKENIHLEHNVIISIAHIATAIILFVAFFAFIIQVISFFPNASVMADQKGMLAMLNIISAIVKYLYVIWNGVTIAGDNNLEIKRLDDMNSRIPDICIMKNFIPMENNSLMCFLLNDCMVKRNSLYFI